MNINVSALTSHFPNPQDGFTTTASGSISSGAATVGLSSTGDYSNGDIVVLIVDPADVDKKQVFVGTVDISGSQLTGVKWVGGVNQAHSSGATIVDYYDAAHVKMMTKGLLVSLDQDGTLRAGAVDNAAALASNVVETAKINDDAVTAAKMVNGMVRSRQGGTSGDDSWATGGTSNTDTSTKNALIQVGAALTSGNQSTTVTFPTAFSQVPTVIATPQGSAGNTSTFYVVSITTTGFAFVAGTPANVATFNWIAVGQ
jgi:H-type lectin domain.